MRLLLSALCFGFFLVFCLFSGCKPGDPPEEKDSSLKTSAGPSFSTISELTDAFSRKMAKEFQDRKIFVDRETIRDAKTGEVRDLSGNLQSELESSLSKQGFLLVYDPSDADFLLGATYERHGDSGPLRISFKCHGKEPESRKSWTYEIAVERLPKDALKETLEGKAVKLVQDVKSIHGSGMRIYVKPIREGNRGFVSDFSRSFMARLRVAMVRLWQGTEIIDERPVLHGLTQSRGIQAKARKVRDLRNWEPVCTDADTVLDGVYFVEGEKVIVALDLKDLKGRLFGSAKSRIPKSIIHAGLDNPEAAALADVGDTYGKEKKTGVRILTGLGGDFPVYLEGDIIRLFVQVQEPLYVYVYDIEPEGKVNRLYPPSLFFSEHRFEPGRLYPLPDETHPFEYMVLPPFGMDLVKVFASTVPLPVPKISSSIRAKSYDGTTRKTGVERLRSQQAVAGERVIHPLDLVDYYRGVAAQKGAELYEDEVMVETRKNGGGQ